MIQPSLMPAASYAARIRLGCPLLAALLLQNACLQSRVVVRSRIRDRSPLPLELFGKHLMNFAAEDLPISNIFDFALHCSTMSKFRFQDRQILLSQEATLLDALGISLCFYDDSDVGEFSTFTVVGECCSTLAVARQGEFLLLWSTKTGADVGSFSSMVDVIQEIAALTFPASTRSVQLPDLTNIKVTSNVVFLTPEQLGRGACIHQHAA